MIHRNAMIAAPAGRARTSGASVSVLPATGRGDVYASLLDGRVVCLAAAPGGGDK
jgi:hypothetical protein